MAVGRRLRGAQRIAAGVRRSRRAAPNSRRRPAHDRAPHRRRSRSRSAPRRRRPRRHVATTTRARRARRIRPSFSIASARRSQREGLARAGRASDRRQERRLDLWQSRKAAPAAARSAPPRARRLRRRRRREKSARPMSAGAVAGPCPWALAGGGGAGGLSPAASAEQTNLRFFADLGQSILLNAFAHCRQRAHALSP